MPITITADVDRAIREHGRADYPHECCGLLLGTLQGDTKRAVEAWPVPNEWTADVALTDAEDAHSLRDRFYVPPKAYLQADRAARAKNLDIVGCYHSHPDDHAQPSERDRTGAAGVGGGPDFSFLVLSVLDGVPDALTSSLLSTDGSAWQAEPLQVEESWQ
jgi:proteasome lid subunit RPN8/RPN11